MKTYEVRAGVYEDKETIEGECPECGGSDIRKYPVLSEGGWFIAAKCQACLCSLSREPWRLTGPVSLLSEGLLPEGVSA